MTDAASQYQVVSSAALATSWVNKPLRHTWVVCNLKFRRALYWDGGGWAGNQSTTIQFGLGQPLESLFEYQFGITNCGSTNQAYISGLWGIICWPCPSFEDLPFFFSSPRSGGLYEIVNLGFTSRSSYPTYLVPHVHVIHQIPTNRSKRDIDVRRLKEEGDFGTFEMCRLRL